MTIGQITSVDIEGTVDEFDQLGRQAFLDKYGFGLATTYLLHCRGRFYDPKAIVGVAHARTPGGQVLKPPEFDAPSAIRHLRHVGFEVVEFSGLWWVNQGGSYRAERDGGYLWAPQQTKGGYPVAHHTDVSKLRPGQLLIHYADNAIRALGRVAGEPTAATRPAELDATAWAEEGFFCPVDYLELADSIPRVEIPDRSSGVGPFDVHGNVKQGYLFRIAHEHVLDLLAFLDKRIGDLFGWAPSHLHAAKSPPGSPSSVSEDSVFDALRTFRNIVLEGVPGTGKTYAVQRLSEHWHEQTGRPLLTFGDRQFEAFVMHPSTSYEDFVEGLRPGALSPDASDDERYFDEPVGTGGQFRLQDGFFLRVCQQAVTSPNCDILVLLDELNRCNLPSVLGDLLLTLEASRRAKYSGNAAGERPAASDWEIQVPARLTYSGRLFFVPNNLYVIGTMNTTDRSVAPMDAALRRRFAFHRLEPEIPDVRLLPPDAGPQSRTLFAQAASITRRLNETVLRPCLGPDAMLGHSYFYAMRDALTDITDGEAPSVITAQWRYSLLPQLIDAVRLVTAEDLLDLRFRHGWFSEHRELGPAVTSPATAVLTELDAYLAELGLFIRIDGIGLTRTARITTTRPSQTDTSSPDAASSPEPEDTVADETTP